MRGLWGQDTRNHSLTLAGLIVAGQKVRTENSLNRQGQEQGCADRQDGDACDSLDHAGLKVVVLGHHRQGLVHRVVGSILREIACC